jgi:hypothetical protein
MLSVTFDLFPFEGFPVAREGLVLDAGVAAVSPIGEPEDFTATIDWGDGATRLGQVLSCEVVPDPHRPEHAYADEGSYQVTVTVTRKGGGRGRQSRGGAGSSTTTIRRCPVPCRQALRPDQRRRQRPVCLWEMNCTSVPAMVNLRNRGAGWQSVNRHPFAAG